MGNLVGKGKVKEVSIEAVVIRADGTREDLGVIAHSKWRFKPWKKERREAKKKIQAINESRIQ